MMGLMEDEWIAFDEDDALAGAEGRHHGRQDSAEAVAADGTPSVPASALRISTIDATDEELGHVTDPSERAALINRADGVKDQAPRSSPKPPQDDGTHDTLVRASAGLPSAPPLAANCKDAKLHWRLRPGEMCRWCQGTA